MSDRRPGSTRSRRRGPGRRPGQREAAARPRPVADVEPEHRSKFTGRAAVLTLVLLVLTMSYGSSLKAYVQQRQEIADLKQTIAERSASISDLEREKRRWQDPAFIQAQARARFGYLMPGETSYVVLGRDGQPLEPGAALGDPDAVLARTPTAWWDSAWSSVQLAGNPPAGKSVGKPPASQIDGTKE